MEPLLEDFLVYLRHERGQSEATQEAYAGLLRRFVRWAGSNGISSWNTVQFNDLARFLEHERKRPLETVPEESTRRLTSESVYLQIAALRALYRFAEMEKLVDQNPAENLSLPKRWKRLPKALSDHDITRLLTPVLPENPASLCIHAVLELG